MFPLMEEGFPVEPHLLESAFRQHKEACNHILLPAHRMSRNGYEYILDLELVSKGSSFGDLDFSLGPHEHGSLSGLHQVPAAGSHSRGVSGECNGSPSWCQTRFKLDRPSPPRSSPFSPPFSPSSENACHTQYLHPSTDMKDSPRQKRRKSCEYCRFRKKKCSGHVTCVRCSRVGIECVYLPDLIAKRMADCRLEIPHPSLGSCSYPTAPMSAAGSSAGQVPDPGYSCVASPTLDNGPPDMALRLYERRAKGKKRASNGTTKCKKGLRPGKASAQSLDPNPDQYTLLGGCPDSAVADLGTAYVELAIHLADSVNFSNTRFQCVSFGVLDRCVMSAPGCWNAFQPQEVLIDTARMQLPGHAEDGAQISEPEASPPGIDPTGVEATCVLGFDTFPSTEAGSFLELLGDLAVPSIFSPSVAPSPSGSALPTDVASDSSESWTADDWLVWYDSTLFPL